MINNDSLAKVSMEISKVHKKKIYHLTIINDKRIICEYSKYRTIYDNYKIHIVKVLVTGRKIIRYKRVEYAYIKDAADNITFLAQISSGFPQQIAFRMLDYVRSHFYATFPAETIKKARTLSQNESYQKTLIEMLEKFSDHETIENLSVRSYSTNRSGNRFEVVDHPEVINIILKGLKEKDLKKEDMSVRSQATVIIKPKIEATEIIKLIEIKRDDEQVVKLNETKGQVTEITKIGEIIKQEVETAVTEAQVHVDLGTREKCYRYLFVILLVLLFLYILISLWCGFGFDYCINPHVLISESSNRLYHKGNDSHMILVSKL